MCGRSKQAEVNLGMFGWYFCGHQSIRVSSTTAATNSKHLAQMVGVEVLQGMTVNMSGVRKGYTSASVS